MPRGRGWHHQSARHALAARGISTRGISLKILPLDYRYKFTKFDPVLGKTDYTMYVYANDEMIASNYFFEENGIIHGEDISVKPGHRRKGIFTYMMNEMIKIADEHGYPIELEVNPNTMLSRGDMDEGQLRETYEKFGFYEYGPEAEQAQMDWYREMNRVGSENIQMWRDPR